MSVQRPKPALNITLWIVQVLVAAMFLFSGYLKISQDQMQVEGFAELGFSPWFLIVVGALEVAGGVGLLIPRLCGLAAACLVALMIGAFIAQLIVMEMLLPPVVVGLAAGLVAWGRRYTIVALPQLWRARS